MRYLTGPAPVPPDIRVLSRTLIGDGCWLYSGTIDTNGYGSLLIGSRSDGSRRSAKAHRVLYEAIVGPVPRPLDLDHLCRVRACVNPSHLEPVTRRENLLRGQTIPAENVRKTHCPQGHVYDEANTRRDRKTNARVCRACKAQQQRRVREQRRSA